MNKTKKVLSLLCALAMIISMFSAFTVASAANDVALNVSVVEDTTMDADDGKVTYQFSISGVSDMDAIGLTMDVDTALFTCSNDAIKVTALEAAGGSLMKNFNANKGKIAINWANAAGANIPAGTVIAEITLTNATAKLATPTEITLSAVTVSAVEGTKYTKANGNIDIPTIKAGSLPQKLNNEVALEKADPTAEGMKAGDKATVAFTIKGVSDMDAIGLTMDVDTTLFSCSNDDIKVAALEAAGGSLMKNFNANKGKVAINWANAAGANIPEGTVIAEVTLTAAVDIADKKTINMSAVTVSAVDGTKYTIANANIEIAPVVIDPNAASGPVITHPITVADGIVNGTITAPTEGVVGKTITVTATPAEGYVLDTITVNGAAIEGTTFTMPDEDVTVSATFKVAPVNYDVTLNAKNVGAFSLGKKIEIAPTGTRTEAFDIVVQVYYDNNTAVGYVVYDEVKVGDTITFYAPQGTYVSVNAVDEVAEQEADGLGELVANPERP